MLTKRARGMGKKKILAIGDVGSAREGGGQFRQFHSRRQGRPLRGFEGHLYRFRAKSHFTIYTAHFVYLIARWMEE